MSSFTTGRATREDGRKGTFKKGIDQDDTRRRREETTIQIRKQKKDDRLNQKRRIAAPGAEGLGAASAPMSGSGGGGVALQPGMVEQKIAQLPELVRGVMEADPSVHLEATTQFRKLLSIEKNPPIQIVIEAGVVPRFVEFLQCDATPALQFEAAWALTNIASGTAEHTRVVIDHHAVPIFVRLLMSPNDDVREQAVWALGNIAGDSAECRNMVLQAAAMEPLLRQLHENSKLSMLRNATWTLSNFCRGKPQPVFDQVRPALPTLAQLIYSPDEEVLTDACWALSYLSDGPNEKIQSVIEAGVCRRLVELLMHASPSVQTPALRTVGNIVTGDDLQTQIIINFSALPCLLALLGSAKKGIRKEACWTISNITAGNKEQIKAVIDSNIVPPLISMLASAEFDIRKEAAWAVSNATSGGSPEQIKYLVSQGCITPLCDLLSVQDAKIITVALEGLENILKVGDAEMKMAGNNITQNQMAHFVDEAGGLEKIENLQNHENTDIYQKVVTLISTYFGVDDDESSALAPQAVAGGGQFAFGAPGAAPGAFGAQTPAAQPPGGFNFTGGMS